MPSGSKGTAGVDTLRLYLDEIGTHPLLTRDDEQRLGRAIDAGRDAARVLAASDADAGDVLPAARRAELRAAVVAGQRAEQQFIEANLRLVVSVAKRYRSSGVALLDLVQEGNLGLMHALEKFDFGRGFKFSTYATWWIRQSITRAIANTGRTIRIPVHAGELVHRVQRAQAQLEGELGRAATVDELARECGMERERVADTVRMAQQTCSIFEPIGAEGDMTLADVIQDRAATPAVDQIITASLPAHVAKLLSVLTADERRVVCLRYGFDQGQARTLAEVGRQCGLSAEGTRQVERRALAKLKLQSRSASLADVLAG